MLNLKDINRARTALAQKRDIISIKHRLLPTSKALTIHSFKFEYVIGKGGFGRVWRVTLKRNKQPFAMKEMLKLRVITKRSVQSVLNERSLLAVISHTFIVNMQYAFRDKDNLYLAMDLKRGGDLRFHLFKNKVFSEEETRFMVACLISGLEYLHVNAIIHRDIKPENLVLDEYGYVHITDFGVARKLSSDNSKDSSGTPGYMAPEVILNQSHGIAVDYFAVGVIAYEFLTGFRPYCGRNRQEIRDHMLSKQARMRKVKGISSDAVDFVNRLLLRKANKRLGSNGPHQLKAHPWFKDFPWKDLSEKKMKAPYVPTVDCNSNLRPCGEWKDELDTSINLDMYQRLFDQYQFPNN